MSKVCGYIIFLSILCAYLIILPSSVKSYASETSSDYSVSIGTTENQRADVNGYFDLRLATNQSDRLPIMITNSMDEEATFVVSFHTATTNSNGIVDYTLDDATLIGKPKINISDLVTLETTEVTIAENSSATIYASVQMPEISFDGILLGGIQVEKKAETISSSSSMVSNEYQYVIAVQLSETDTTVTPDLVGGEVSLEQDNGYNAVSMSIDNQSAVLLSKLSGIFTIINKRTGKELVSETKENLSIAPNSSFSLLTLLDNPFEAGSYTYSITLNNGLGEWTFSKDFTISEEDVITYNKTSVDEQDPVPFWTYLVGFLIFVIVVLVVLLGKEHRSKS